MEWLFVKDLKRVPGIISATLPLKEGKQMKSKLYLVLVPFCLEYTRSHRQLCAVNKTE